MSLYEKSRNSLFQEFLKQNLGQAYGNFKKAYTRSSFEKVINNQDKDKVYSILFPIYFAHKELFSNLSRKKKSVTIAIKAKKILRFLPITEVFIFGIDMSRKKFNILYGGAEASEKTKLKSSLIMNYKLLRELNKRESMLTKHQALLEKSFSAILKKPLKNYAFQKVSYANNPRLLIVYKLEFSLYNYKNVEKIMEGFFAKIFYQDLFPARKKALNTADLPEAAEFEQGEEVIVQKLLTLIKPKLTESDIKDFFSSLAIKGVVFLERCAKKIEESIYFISDVKGINLEKVNNDLFIHYEQLSQLQAEHKLGDHLFSETHEFIHTRLYLYDMSLNKKMVIVFENEYAFKEVNKNSVKMKILYESIASLFSEDKDGKTIADEV